MTFSPTIPQATDLLSQSQVDIQTNFSQSNTIIGANHVNFNNSLPVIATLGYLTAAADEGKHTIIHTKMINAATAAPVTAANEGAYYAKELVAGQRVEAFYRYNTSGSLSLLSAIKAWAYIDGAGAIIGTQSWNVSATARTAGGTFQIDMPAGTLTNANYAVIATSTRRPAPPNCLVCNYEITNVTRFVVTTIDPIVNSLQDPSSVSIIVIQIGG
jgi:hypothetical protein